jgi:membrane protease YdiL (CAAX protease family)
MARFRQVGSAGSLSDYQQSRHLTGAFMATTAAARPESEFYGRIASPLHTILVLAAQGALVVRGFIRVDQTRAMGTMNRMTMYERTILSEWLMLALVILGVWLHGSPLRTVLGERWNSARLVVRDIGIAIAFWIGSTLILSIFGAHAHGASSDRAVQFLLPQGGLEMSAWIVLSITAGICEEAIFRGYFQRQFMALTKSIPIGILLSAVAFGAAHSYQGLGGAVRIGLQGGLLGILANWRRSVRPGMMAHAWSDIFAGALARLMKIRVG